MAINVQKLAARLKEIEDGQKASGFAKLLWKPKEGIQVVRIVPYKFNSDSPFIELKFYYNLGGNHYLAPCTFGKPDPIMEVVEALRSSGSNEEKEIAAKLTPTVRTYAPVIVRGEEELGVRFWGFGIQVYTQLLTLTTKPAMWGDITSLTEGNDLEVEFHKIGKKKNAKGDSFPETKITPYPTKTPVVDPTRKDLLDKVRDQTDILQIFPLKSYEELKDAVEKWLHPEEADAVSESNGSTSPTAALVTATSITASPAAASVPTAAGVAPTGEKLAEEFEHFFQKK